LRAAVVSLVLVGCGGSSLEPRTFEFGPFDLQAGQEINGGCVSATLHNDETLYINAVELETAAGFHHSNWFWVPDNLFTGPDGAWRCNDRQYDEAIAGLQGGVLFAQSTQAQHELQAFAPGVAIVVPPHAKIVASTHLLNPTDAPTTVPLALTITPIAHPTTLLSGMAFQDMGILLPPESKSRWTIECPLDEAYRNVVARPLDYAMYYVLPHYHELGTGISLEAVRADGTATTIFENTQVVGEALGRAVDPAFSLVGYEKLRFSCNYQNSRTTQVGWGNGGGEMCIFLAFTDAAFNITGGRLSPGPPIRDVDHGDFVEHFHDCGVLMAEAVR
jgi:hypothetical protein